MKCPLHPLKIQNTRQNRLYETITVLDNKQRRTRIPNRKEKKKQGKPSNCISLSWGQFLMKIFSPEEGTQTEIMVAKVSQIWGHRALERRALR